MHPVREVTQVL